MTSRRYPPMPADRTVLPVLYRSERGTGGWRTLPILCPTCRGSVVELGDVIGCLLCGRVFAELQDERPGPKTALDQGPRRGRPPGPTKRK